MTTTPFTTYAYPATGMVTPRTTPARFGDVFNVMDFGAIGTGSPDQLSTRYGSLAAAQAVYPFVTSLTQTIDYAAIQLAINTMWASSFKAGTLYIPPGNYVTSTPIDIGNHVGGGNNTCGRIVGGGRGCTFINGTINNDFLMFEDGGVNGPEELSHFRLVNGSSWIGSGALRLNNSSMVIDNVGFGGMMNVFLPFDIYDVAINNCTGGCSNDPTTGFNGTLGIAGYAPHIKNWRCTNNMMVAFALWGGNGSHLDGNGIENCATALLLGMFTGWASACTVSGNVLTVGGVLGNPSSFIQFSVGMILYGRGLDLPAWGSDPNVAGTGVTIIGDHSTDGTLTGVGYAGTYRLSRSGYSITTPVPVISMYQGSLSGCTITSLQTEACHHSVYINSVSACNIAGAGFGSGPEECVNQFGQKGLCPRAPLYLRGASATKISGCASACSTSQLGGVYIDNVGQSTNAVSFDSCTSQKAADNTVTASIKNAAGTGAGDILNVTVFSSGLALGVGMLVTGSGVTAGTTIIANSSIDATLTGYIGTGTYRVNNSQNVSSETMTVVTGNDWVLPTNVETLTGLQIVNCSGNGTGLNSLGMTFASLPGEVTSNTHIQRMEGAKYSIVDGQKTGPATALMGDIVIGGGSQHIEVRWNGTSWTRSG